MDSPPHRIGPALTMAAPILAAALPASLAPFHMRAPGTEAEFRHRLHTTRGAY
ncbi:hypothetical protein [Leucobacter triazinivorans]|uniref:hypothetical protein n=1 Tax=Leucobacter triazinivorans TaxID=1784719 RepID=UPI0013EE5C09|nr:hypothetical protein [Leucobacter triazinivorans]